MREAGEQPRLGTPALRHLRSGHTNHIPTRAWRGEWDGEGRIRRHAMLRIGTEDRPSYFLVARELHQKWGSRASDPDASSAYCSWHPSVLTIELTRLSG